MKSYKSFKRKILRDDVVRKHYEELGPEFAVIEILLKKRIKRGFTQRDLAKKVGTSRQTICAMEKGDYIPSLKLALLIARHFKRPVEDVFTLKKCPM